MMTATHSCLWRWNVSHGELHYAEHVNSTWDVMTQANRRWQTMALTTTSKWASRCAVCAPASPRWLQEADHSAPVATALVATHATNFATTQYEIGAEVLIKIPCIHPKFLVRIAHHTIIYKPLGTCFTNSQKKLPKFSVLIVHRKIIYRTLGTCLRNSTNKQPKFLQRDSKSTRSSRT